MLVFVARGCETRSRQIQATSRLGSTNGTLLKSDVSCEVYRRTRSVRRLGALGVQRQAHQF